MKVMRGVVKRSLRLLLAISVLSSVGFAIPLCSSTPVTLSTVLAGGFQCLVGSSLFVNFAFTGSETGSGFANDHAINTSNITIALAYNSPNDVVTVSNNDLASWTLTGTQAFSFTLGYQVQGGTNGDGSITGGNYFNNFAASLQGASITGP